MIMEETKPVNLERIRIGIIGLGYVGLPLAVEFGKKFKTVGFDINKSRISELKKGIDKTLEVSSEQFLLKKLSFSNTPKELKDCNVYIVTVPTPIDKECNPDLKPLINASKLVGKYLDRGDLVIFESTVYPGATEELCAPIIAETSNLVFNQDFFCGYSPERINPGDKDHTLPDIIKVTSGSTEEIANFVDKLYKTIIVAGTFKAKNIKTAEAAKVIENTQRDVNIALVNELAIIFKALNLNTQEVLETARTKWNFLPFNPGLVGGHCIGVDPYYLTYKSLQEGYKPEMILSGRKLNDNMALFISETVVSLMHEEKIDLQKAEILILGFSFKENCPDFRNTKVIDLYDSLIKQVKKVDVFDPMVDPEEVELEYNIKILSKIRKSNYDGIILAVAHDLFLKYSKSGFKEYAKDKSVIYDIKNFLPDSAITARL
jgi:UDP-N-acetyl-D-galactosamine dehydrogenase